MQRDETPEERVIRETKDETIDERAAREEREKNPPKTVIVTGEKSARSAPKMPRPAGSPPGQPREVGRHDGTPSPKAGMSGQEKEGLQSADGWEEYGVPGIEVSASIYGIALIFKSRAHLLQMISDLRRLSEFKRDPSGSPDPYPAIYTVPHEKIPQRLQASDIQRIHRAAKAGHARQDEAGA